MRSKYDSMLPSGDSQMRGGNRETGGRHDSPHKQEKPPIRTWTSCRWKR
ncbi:MAG: hypothetical protein IJ887_06845 [Prevotella sp.]|nr:hypothetical protein [Prevotella sp.]MBR3479391.1 hypothetical protein [Prevotella sp.]